MVGPQGQVTSLAYGWRLERSDGVTLGFTSHDRDVVVDGITLKASPGMHPTTIIQSVGMDIDGLEVSGALTSDMIRAQDLAAGRWDGATLDIFLFDWAEPVQEKQLLAAGELGAVSFANDAFDAELIGPQALLDKPVAPQTSPACRATFCDSACGLNRERFRRILVVSSIDANNISVAGGMGLSQGHFAQGEMRWLSGKNTGIAMKIADNSDTAIQLFTAVDSNAAAGDRIELIEGCDKLLSTCATRFDNAINFRGEPYLPGNDILTRYPGGN